MEESNEVDEDAPQSIAELSELTSLSESVLAELEESILAKQQTVLVGPPGTSKTYIARQFARYFVRQRSGRPQGSHHVLYMHANWTYEDFFEGIKPTTTKEGALTFQPKKGFFLEWVEQLKSFNTTARHVLVLDEINRCDTAAVLGELLQLLEYRGTTVQLLSGRQFVFPRNLFIIGTMNSADRSIGRMDLALRRRFLWLNLHAQTDTLQRWLSRLGNNPVGFKSSTLDDCNKLLATRGIPPEQHIGHALFMAQESDVDDETGVAQDIPLTEKHLRRIVNFSVLPYVRELFATQFGQVDEKLISVIRGNLLSCLNEENSEPSHA
ncbi:MAG: AAA family ATPase [Pirellulales bacterium]